MVPSVALEGPCCAGKTTLGRGMLSKFPKDAVNYIVDYSDYVGGGGNLPSAIPQSVADEEAALGRFLEIEGDRQMRNEAPRYAFTLIDRSVHTLLAHCHALELMTGRPYSRAADNILKPSPVPLWPDQIFYLDISPDEASRRNKGKFSPGSIFMDVAFNQGIRSYFWGVLSERSCPVIWFDASLSRSTLLNAATSTAVVASALKRSER